MHKSIISVGILKEIFKFSSKIVTEFRVRITHDGWEIDFVDPYNTMLASIRASRDIFENYTLEPEIGEEIEAGIDVRIADILTIFKDRELAEITVESSISGEKCIGDNIHIKVQNLTYTRALMDPTAIRRPPKIDIIEKVIDASETQGAKLTISLSELRDVIRSAPSEYDKLLFHCKPEEAYIFNGVEKKELTDFEAAKETVSLYDIKYLEPILTLRTASTLEVYYTEDQPCIIIPDTRFTLRYAVAPYIPEDKTEYLPSEVKPEWEIPLSEEMLKVYRKPLKIIEPVFLVIDEKNLYFVEAVGVGEKYAITAYVEIEYPVHTQVEARGTYDLFSEFKTIVGKSKEITLNERDGKLYAGEVEVGKRSELTVTAPKPEGKHFYVSTRNLLDLVKVEKNNIALKCEKEKLAEFICFIEDREDPEGSVVSETYCPDSFIRVFNIPKRYVIGKWAEIWCLKIGGPVFIVFSEVKKEEEYKLLTYISDIIPEREKSLIEEVKRQLRIIKEPPLFAEIESFVKEASVKLVEFDGEQPNAKLKMLDTIGRQLRSGNYIRLSIWAQSKEPIGGYNRLIEQGEKFLEELNALGYEDKIKEHQEKLAAIEGWTVKRDALKKDLNNLSVRIERIKGQIENNIEWAKHNLDIFNRDFAEAKDIIKHFSLICKAVARVYDKLKFKKVKAEIEYDQYALKECLKDYAECNLAKFSEDAAKHIAVAYWAKTLTKAFKELPVLWKEEIVERFKYLYDMMHKPSVDALFFELAAEAEKYKPPAKPPVKLEEMLYIYRSPRPLTAAAFPQFFRVLEEEGIKYVLSEDMFEIGTDKPVPVNFVEELELKLKKTPQTMSLKEFADYFKVSVEDAARSIVEASREDLLHDVKEAIDGTKTFNKYMVESSADSILKEAKEFIEKPVKIEKWHILYYPFDGMVSLVFTVRGEEGEMQFDTLEKVIEFMEKGMGKLVDRITGKEIEAKWDAVKIPKPKARLVSGWVRVNDKDYLLRNLFFYPDRGWVYRVEIYDRVTQIKTEKDLDEDEAVEIFKPKVMTPEERVAELKKELNSIRKTYETAEKVKTKAETLDNLNDFGIAVSVLESSLEKIDKIIERADAIYKKFGLMAASILSSEASALKDKISSLKSEFEGKIDRILEETKVFRDVEESLWACEAVRDVFDEIKWKKLPLEEAADQEFFKIALKIFSTCDKRKIKNHFAISAEGYWLNYISKAIEDIDIDRAKWRDEYRKLYEFMFKESVEKLYDAIKAKKAEIEVKPPKPYPTELKDYAAMLISVQKHIEKGWHPIAVDLANDEIQLYNPEAPYRKRHRYKKMTKREREFFKAISDALTIVAEESRLPMIAAHIVSYSEILIPPEKVLKDYPELLKRVEEIRSKLAKHEFGIEVYRAGEWHLTHSPGLGYKTYQEAEKRAIELAQTTGERHRVVEYDYIDAERTNVKEYPPVKPPVKPAVTPEIEKRVEELGVQIFQFVDRLKFLQTAKATEEVIEEAEKIKAECEAKKPEIDELLDKIPEKTDLYEKAYDVWSSVRTCIDKAQRLEKEAREWMEKMPELRKRILSEISRLESEYNIKISEGDVHIFVTDLLKELRKTPEEYWDKRISGSVKEFVEEQRKMIVEIIPAAERARLKGIIAGEISIQSMRMNVKPPVEERRAFEEILLKEIEKVEKNKRAKYIEDKVRDWFLEKVGEWKAIPPEKPPGVPVEKPPTPPPPEVIEIKSEDVAKKLIAELSTELGLARMSRSEVERIVKERLDDINRLAEDVAKGKIAEEKAIEQIKEIGKKIIEKLPPPPPPPRVRIAYRRFLLARLLRVSPDDLRTTAENIDKFPAEEVERAVREALDARLTRANVDRALELFMNSDFLRIAEHVGLRAEVERMAEEARKLKEMFEATVSPTRLNVMVKLLANNIERGIFTFRPDDVCKIAPFINLADPDLVSRLREVIRTMREPERPISAKRFHELTEHECFKRLVEVL